MIVTRLSSTFGPIGIDFATTGVKLLQLRRQKGQLHVHAARRVPLPADRNDRWGNDAAEAIRAAIRDGRFVGKRCVVSMPRNDVAAQSVRMPHLATAELREAVKWEAAERFHLDRDSIQTDFVRLGEIHRGSEARDEVLLIAAERERLGQCLDPILAAGLRPASVDIQPAALVRFHSMRCRRDADRGHVRAILEIGASGTNIVVARGDQIALCKSLDIGGEMFDQSVADHLGIELDVARELRRIRIARAHGDQAGHDGEDPTRDRAMFEAVRGHLDHICKELGLCMRYFGVTFRGQPPDRIILAGGDGLEPHLDQMASQAANVPAMHDDPVSPAEELMGNLSEHLGSGHAAPWQCWAVAAGLSLRGLVRAQRHEPQDEKRPVRREAA